MSDTVPVAFSRKFHDDFIMLSQQRNSRLQRTVRDDPDRLDGKFGYFDRIGATHTRRRTQRHGDTPYIPTPHSRRRIGLSTFDWADLIDHADGLRMIHSAGQLSNRYLSAARMAFNRDKDDLIIAAANGSAYSIDEDLAATEVALPSGQKIAVNASGLTLAKLLATKEKLDAAEVDEEEDRYFVTTSKQVTNMFNVTEIKSSDYNTVKALAEGKINSFLGFEFIRSERLTADANGDRLCLAYARNGIGLAMGEDVITKVTFRDDKNYAMQPYAEMNLDATRIEDEKVVQVACQEN